MLNDLLSERDVGVRGHIHWMDPRGDSLLPLGWLYGLGNVDDLYVILYHIPYRLGSSRALALPDDVLNDGLFLKCVTRIRG